MIAIDPTTDTLIPLAEAARRFLPDPPSPTCMWRWMRHGIVAGTTTDGQSRRVKLATVRIGRRRYTTAKAFRAFAAELNPQDVVGHSSGDLTEQEADTDHRLEKLGLLSSE